MTQEQLDISIDIETLTIGELEEVEEITGQAFGNIDWDHMSAKLMRALVFVSGKRGNPDFSMDDARNVRITALFKPKEEEVSTEADPTPSLSVNGVA